jgi:hypothetical protein
VHHVGFTVLISKGLSHFQCIFRPGCSEFPQPTHFTPNSSINGAITYSFWKPTPHCFPLYFTRGLHPLPAKFIRRIRWQYLFLLNSWRSLIRPRIFSLVIKHYGSLPHTQQYTPNTLSQASCMSTTIHWFLCSRNVYGLRMAHWKGAETCRHNWCSLDPTSYSNSLVYMV